MVEADPSKNTGLLARFRQTLRLESWRRVQIGLFPLALALLIGGAHFSGWTRVTDHAIYDLFTLNEAGRKPVVAIVQSDPAFNALGAGRYAQLARFALAQGAQMLAFSSDPGFDPQAEGIAAGRFVVARPVARVPGARVWQTSAATAGSAAGVLASAEAGVHRQQIWSLPGQRGTIPAFETAAAARTGPGQPYWLRLSRRQNLPQVNASQVLSGELGRDGLKGMIVLVEPRSGANEVWVNTPRDIAAQKTNLLTFNALGIQTLVDRREVRPLDPRLAFALLVAFALVSGVLYLRSDPKRIMPLLLLTSMVLIVAGGWLLMELTGLFPPITALLGAQFLSAMVVLQRAEVSEDRSLRRFVTQTTNLSSNQVLLKDLGRLPQFLDSVAPRLGIVQSAVFEAVGGQIEQLASSNADFAEVVADRKALRAALRRARRSEQPIEASALVPGWSGTARLAALGPSRGEVYWLYAFPPEKAQGAAMHTAATLAAEYRAILRLRADLSAGSDRRHDYRPVLEWVGGAVRLIAERGQQVATGLDPLETGVMVFHPIGFPLYANAAMENLFAALGLALNDKTVPELLKALTNLSDAAIDAALSDLLLQGGEIRADTREIDARLRQVRVAAPAETIGGQGRTISVEVVDISEPRRLAQLQLNLTNLIDVSIRNDLDAIGFALAAAGSRKLDPPQLDRVIGQIGRAVDRAANRLDELAPHLAGASGDPAGQCLPIDASAVAAEAVGRVQTIGSRQNVTIAQSIPAISGFTIADPKVLIDMIEAMLKLALADSPPGESIALEVAESEKRTRITITGGGGMAFERLYAALAVPAANAPDPFRAISLGLAAATRWGAEVSYSSRIGKGYRFAIDMRRIG